MHRRRAAFALALAVITGILGNMGSLPTQAQDATPQADCAVTTPEQNAALVRAYWETVYNGKDPARVADFLAEDFVRHDPDVSDVSQPGLADDVARTDAQLADFPDLLVRVDDLLAEEDKVAARLTWSGTQLGALEPWGAPATGRSAEFMAISIMRTECGRLAEEWAVFDDLSMMRQLGIITDEELATGGSATSATAAANGTPTAATTAPAQSGRPRVFIASSVEGLPVAEAIQVDLQFFADVTIWEQGVFHPSQGSLSAIDEAASQSDFAVVVLTPDDMTTKRGRTYDVPRDNVIFELGFFMGRLGIDRTFMVTSRDNPPTLPSDLQGVTTVTYAERADGNLEAEVGPAAIQIREAMQAVIAAEGVHPDRD